MKLPGWLQSRKKREGILAALMSQRSATTLQHLIGSYDDAMTAYGVSKGLRNMIRAKAVGDLRAWLGVPATPTMEPPAEVKEA